MQTGYPLGGYITVGGAPKQLPQQGSSLGKYPWLFGEPPVPLASGAPPNDFGLALGQKARPAPMGVNVGKSLGPRKGQQGGFFGQPFKGGIF